MKKIKILGALMTLLWSSSSFHINVKNKEQTINANMKLVYVYDALCGWCYGFGGVMEKVDANYKEVLPLQVMSGGMIPKAYARPIGHMSNYILQTLPRLERMTGATVGEPYKKMLREGTYVMSSEPPAIALSIVKSMDSTKAFSFAHTVQKNLFIDMMDINTEPIYLDAVKKLGMDTTEFNQKWTDSTYYKAAQDEFRQVQQLHVSGFPALFLVKDNQWIKLSEGYASYESIEKQLSQHGISPKK
ncbi:MAG: DsbA family protein [Cytophagaceae bacterium]